MENNLDLIEQSILTDLETIHHNANKLVVIDKKHYDKFNIRSTKGTSGNSFSLNQMKTCEGQRIVHGKILQEKFNDKFYGNYMGFGISKKEKVEEAFSDFNNKLIEYFWKKNDDNVENNILFNDVNNDVELIKNEKMDIDENFIIFI